MRLFLSMAFLLSSLFVLAQEVEQTGDKESSAVESQEIETESEEAPSTNNEEVLSPETNADSLYSHRADIARLGSLLSGRYIIDHQKGISYEARFVIRSIIPDWCTHLCRDCGACHICHSNST